jgi:hypothetical protein
MGHVWSKNTPGPNDRTGVALVYARSPRPPLKERPYHL